MLEKLKKNSPKNMGPYLGSKWIHYHFFIDQNELEELLAAFNTCYLFPIGKMFLNYENNLQVKIIKEYKSVIENLKSKVVNLNSINSIFPIAISKTIDAFYLYSPKDNLHTIKIEKPVLQLQVGTFRYSSITQTIQLNSLGSDTIFWGFKLSYPQIFQDPKSNQIVKVNANFDNFSYFALVRKWIRENTYPVRFKINQKKIVTPLRIGKKCISWINFHPQLKEIGCELDYAY
jgi:hypothetical protein